jgi:hypothetical protein
MDFYSYDLFSDGIRFEKLGILGKDPIGNSKKNCADI